MRSVKEQYWRYSLFVIILVLGVVIFAELTPYIGGLLGAMTIYVLLRRQMRYLTVRRRWRRRRHPWPGPGRSLRRPGRPGGGPPHGLTGISPFGAPPRPSPAGRRVCIFSVIFNGRVSLFQNAPRFCFRGLCNFTIVPGGKMSR